MPFEHNITYRIDHVREKNSALVTGFLLNEDEIHRRIRAKKSAHGAIHGLDKGSKSN
jgi:hypothetical protein